MRPLSAPPAAQSTWAGSDNGRASSGQTAELVRGLRQLGGARPRSAAAGGTGPRRAQEEARPRSAAGPRRLLGSKSSICERASRRCSASVTRLVDLEVAHPRGPRVPEEAHASSPLLLASASAPTLPSSPPGPDSVSDLIHRIEAMYPARDPAKQPLEQPVVTLHVGQLHTQVLPARSRQQFIVPLPPRAADVRLSLAGVSGSSRPSMSAAVIYGGKPASQDEFTMQDDDEGDIHYRHSPGEAGSRALSMGLATALSVVVESEKYCEFSLRCALRRSTVDGVMLLGVSKESVLARIEKKKDLYRNNPAERKALEDRLQRHLAERMKHVPATLETREQREHRQQLQAAHAKQKRGTVVIRRQELDQAAEDRIAREEEKLQEKGARLLRRKELVQQDRMRDEWVKTIIAVSVATHIGARISYDRGWREHLRSREEACIKIQSWLFRAHTRRRRRFLLQNAIRLRGGVLAVCRTLQLAATSMAQPALLWFLQMHTGHKVQPSLVGIMKDFIFKVKKLQRTWRRIQLQRSARVEALLPHFLAEPLAGQVLARRPGRTAPAAPFAPSREEGPGDRGQQQRGPAKRADKRRAGSRTEPPPFGSRPEPQQEESGRPRTALASGTRRSGAGEAGASGGLREPPAELPGRAGRRNSAGRRRNSQDAGRRRNSQELRESPAEPPGRARGNSTGRRRNSQELRESPAEPPGRVRKNSAGRRRNSQELRESPRKTRRRKPAGHRQSAADLKEDGEAHQAPRAAEGPTRSTPTAGEGATVGDLPAFVQAFKGEELLPLVVRKEALYRHVREMQQTYTDRIREWSSRMADVDMQVALVKITSNSSLSILEQIKEQRRRPQVVDVRRMKDLYEETYVAFLEGEFKEVVHRHTSLMKIFFRRWKRVAHNVKIGQFGKVASRDHGSLIHRLELRNQLRQLRFGDDSAAAGAVQHRGSEPAVTHHRFTVAAGKHHRSTVAAGSPSSPAAVHHRSSLGTVISSNSSEDEA